MTASTAVLVYFGTLALGAWLMYRHISGAEARGEHFTSWRCRDKHNRDGSWR